MSEFGLIASSLEHVRKGMTHAAEQNALSTVDGAHRADMHASARIQDGKIVGVESYTERFEAPFEAAILRKQISDFQAIAVQSQYMNKVVECLGNTKTSGVNISVATFLTSAKAIADSGSDLSLRENFVAKAKDVCERITSAADYVNVLRSNVDADIVSVTTSINDITRSLYDLNILISSHDNPHMYHDKRDILLNELSCLISIDVKYGEKGIVLVDTVPRPISLVTRNGYAELNYTQDQSLPEVVIRHRNNAMNEVGRAVDSVTTFASSTTSVINGGKLLGLMSLRNTALPEVTGMLDDIAIGVMEQVNKIYCSGSGVPPKTKLMSDKVVTLSDVTVWTGKMKIAVLNTDGRPQVMDNAAALRSLEIDFSSVNGARGVGKLSTQEIINEINARFYEGIANQRLALGQIPAPAGVVIPVGQEQYLLSNINLVGDSIITDDGSMNLRLELDNQSAFTTTVEVLDVRVYDELNVLSSQLATADLPNTVTVNAGDSIRTTENISVDLPLGGAKATIAVKFRVLGTNGVMEEGYATFQINNPVAGEDKLNTRIYGVPAAGAFVGLGAGSMVTKAALSTAPVLTAELVNEDGFAIAASDTEVPGKFMLRAASGYSVVIDDGTSSDQGLDGILAPIPPTHKGFCDYFGFNNFFTGTDAVSMAVRSDLANNSSLVAIGKVGQVPKAMQKVVVGDVAAKAEFTITGNNPAVNDTITVQGVTFTFKAAAASDAEITIGATDVVTTLNIIAKLKADNDTTRPFKDLVTFDAGSATSVLCTAKIAGTWGNNIAVNSNITGVAGNNAWYNTTPAAVITLADGTNKEEEQLVTNFADEISTGSRQVMQELESLLDQSILFERSKYISGTPTTLVQYVTSAVTAIAANCNNAKTHAENEEQATLGMQKKLQDGFKIDRNKVMMNAYELQRIHGEISYLLSTWRKMSETLMRAMGG